MLPLLVKLRQIDRRVISGLVMLVLVTPLVFRLHLPVVEFPATVQLKETIDAVPRDKLIVLAMDWDSSTRGECGPLTTSVMDYLMRENRPFAIFSFMPQGPELSQQIAEHLAKRYGKKYGQHWLNWGFNPSYATTLMAMMNDLPGTLKTDIRKADLRSHPLMAGVHTLKDVGLIYEVTGTGLLDVYIQYCGGVPMAHGCTAVIGPQQYNYLQSGQIKGLLVGLGGAAQFEKVSGFTDDAGRPGGVATQRMGSQSLGHLLVILLIILGNLGVWATRKLGLSETPVEVAP